MAFKILLYPKPPMRNHQSVGLSSQSLRVPQGCLSLLQWIECVAMETNREANIINGPTTI